MNHRLRALLTLLSALFVASFPARAQTFYTSKNIGHLGGYVTVAAAINSAGQVTGGSEYTYGPSHAFLWSASSGMRDLAPSWEESFGQGIEATGKVVGYAQVSTAQSGYRAFWWNGVGPQLLPSLTEGAEARAHDISDTGLIVGWSAHLPSSGSSGEDMHAVMWRGGLPQALSDLGGKSLAVAVNGSGQAAGMAVLPDGRQHAVMWDASGAIHDLGALGGRNSEATDINAAGQVVGNAETADGATHAFLWSAATGMVDLGVLGADTRSESTGINDAGQVIGTSYNPATYRSRPFLYTAGAMLDVSRLFPSTGFPFSSTGGINATGQIMVNGSDSSGNDVALRLTPGTAQTLGFRAQPSDTTPVTFLDPAPTIVVIKPDGTVNTAYSGAVTVALKVGTGTSGAVLSGTKTVNAVQGVARFTNLSIDRAGRGYVLTATTGSGILAIESEPFSIGLKTLYVSPSGGAPYDGSSWAAATSRIQDALDSPLRMGKSEIWVAAGTYAERLAVPLQAAAYGGFAGTETARAQRDVLRNLTLLLPPQSFNAAVTFTTGADTRTIVDGVTVRLASSIYGGGTAFQCDYASPAIRNVTVQNAGVAVDVRYASPIIEGNTFQGVGGVGIRLEAAGGVVRGNSVSRFARGIQVNGSTLIERNTVTDNTGANGGGIVAGPGNPVIQGNVILRNGNGATLAWGEVLGDGGGIACGNTYALIANNTVVANSAPRGGGIFINGGGPTLVNNIVAFGSSGVFVAAGTPVFRDNCVFGNADYAYSGVADPTGTSGNIAADPLLASYRQGDVHLQPESPCRDAGDGSVAAAGTLDMDGQSRIQGAKVDISADESDGSRIVVPSPVVRVRPTGDDANDGSSWAKAKKTVQAAIDARPGGEVWVAAGTYVENLWAGPFTALYGGFAGTETSREQRNPAANASVLDGGNKESALRLTVGAFGVVVDGFTIQNGVLAPRNPPLRDGPAAGVEGDVMASATVTNNLIRACQTGIRALEGASLIAGNRLIGNAPASPGTSTVAAISVSGQAVVRDNVVEDNGVTGTSYCEGITMGGTALAERNVVRRQYGLGIVVGGTSTARNNTVSANSHGGISVPGAGAARGNLVFANPYVGITSSASSAAAAPTIVNNTIVGNGTGLSTNTYGVVVNNIIAFNQRGATWSTGTFTRNCFYANPDGDVYAGLPAGNITADPLFMNRAAGDYHLAAGSPCRDAGDNAFVPAGSLDLDGRPRILGAQVDIGTYEMPVLISLSDVRGALRVLAGLAGGKDALPAWDAVPTGASQGRIDLQDAAKLARKAAGLEPNP